LGDFRTLDIFASLVLEKDFREIDFENWVGNLGMEKLKWNKFNVDFIFYFKGRFQVLVG
jgi:hypothetical protein